MNTPPRLKLQYHQSNDSRGIVTDDVRLSSRNTPGVSAGDVIEVYHPGDAHHALFLVSALREDIQWRDTISIEQSLANILKLQAHKNVCIRIVEKKSVTLDLVELCFRDQYFSRSDLYRFSQELLGTVLQVHRKIAHNEMRVQVGELWRKGEVYSCGYVGPETKIVFRSATSVIQIFIQLSEEMWLFDEHGDLYFENALKFLSKLFLRAWPEGNCHHDVTVVFFTRAYIDDLPSVYHGRASRDSEGRFFDDFYRVLIQNERLSWDEWKRVLTQLKLEFKMFQQELTAYLQSRYPMHDGCIASSVHVSSAFDGNFMETLNMSLNLYAGYNVDRNFDRTGKSSIVISPGNGSHRVNSTLLLITKQRIMDLGVGVDLICLGQQPLHAVPLLEVSDWDTNKYIVPYWIDCSFFRSGHQIRRINLGQPVNRTRVTPCVSSPCCGLDFAANIASGQQSPVQFQLRSCSTAVARRKPPVYKIIYPQSTVNLMPSLKPPPSENAHFLSGRFTSSPETNESSKCLQSCADQNLFPSTTDHVLTAITTASAVARAVQNANRRPSRCSESDSSSVGDFDWERGLESLAPDSRCSAHRGSLSVEKSLIKSSTQPMIVKGQNTRHLSVVASLPSVREHQSESIRSGQLDRVCFMQAVHRNVVDSEARKKSLSTDADGSVSASSSVDSLITPGSAEFRPPGTTRHTRFSKTYSLTVQRPSSYVGSSSDQASKTPALPGLHTQLTPSAPSYRRKSSSRPIRTGLRWSNTFGSGVRVSSTLFPVPVSNNPFEAAGNPLSPTGTAGKRRWVLVRPPDEFGNPIPPHHIHLSVRSWDFPNPREAIESCSQVWAAYFNFLRERLGHSAPGGPLPSMDHMDSRTIAARSSDHAGRSLKLRSGTSLKYSVSQKEETWLKGQSLLDETSSFGPNQWKSLFDPIQQCSVQNDPPHCSGGLLGQSCQVTGGSALKCLIDTVRNARNSTSHPPLFLPSEDRAQSHTRGARLKKVLRLIGTDWKSLSTPALLPIATDYFPDNSSLKTEGYTLHDYRVVPVGVSAQEWESTHDFKREPGLSYCRRPMTVREVFYEMVLQRLGHGFQIYEESLAPSAPPVSSTVGSPGSPLSGTVTGVSPPSLLRSSASKPATTRCEQLSNRSISGSSSLSRKHGVSLGQGRLANRHRNAPEAPSIGVSPPTTQPTQTCTTIAVRTLGIGLTLSSTGSSVRASSKHLARPGRAGCRTPFLTQPLLDKLMPAHKTSFKLSIGRLFHSISLVDDSITLTNYRFRQEDPLRMEYTYALRVPDSLTYLPLRTVFTNDTINGLNWSYLDNYLCTRGVSDSYVLLPSLKYWRSRFMMLPIYSNETRRLQDAVKERMNTNGPPVACDVYEDYRLMNHAKFCENFVHFIESINRIRRPPSAARKPARQHPYSPVISPLPSVTGPRVFKFGDNGLWSFTNIVDTPLIEGSAEERSLTHPMGQSRSRDPIQPSTFTHGDNMNNKFELDLKNAGSLYARRHTHAVLRGLGHPDGRTSVQLSRPPGNVIDPGIPAHQISDPRTHSLWVRARSASASHLPQVTKPSPLKSTVDKPEMSQRARDLSSSSAGPMADTLSAAGKIRCPSTAGAVVPSGTTVPFQRFLTGLLASTSQSTSGSETNLNIVQNSATDDQTCITSIPASMDSLGSASDLPPAGNVTPIRTAHPTLVSLWSSLKASSTPLPCIVILMADSENGVPFIQAVGTTAFPERTFMSFDAVVWTMKWLSDIETVEQAVSYLQTLLDAGWIRHASGNPAHAFIFGCYIYTLLLPDTKLLSPTCTDASNISFLDAVDVTGQSTPITPSQPHFAGLSNAASQTSINTCQNLGQTKGSDIGTNVSIAPIPGSLTIQPMAFPESFLPRATSGSTEWSADFQTDWAEVAFAHSACSSSRSPSHSTTDLNRYTLDTTVNHGFPSSFCSGGFLTYTNISALCDVKSKTGYQELESVLYKSCLCDFDDPTPEGRTEWAHVLYTANFHPHCAFTIELQWLVASGARLTELVNHWHNRAGMSEFHFFPIPCHPFGHAGIFPNVDPLRCPLSIPLNVAPLLRYATEMLSNRASSAGTLKDSPVLPPSWNGQSSYSAMVVASKLFVGYPGDQQLHLLRSFQHQLLNRFGFIRDAYDADQNPADGTNFIISTITRNWTYVHCSGSIFVMIPVYRTESHMSNLPSEEMSTNLTGCNTWTSVQPPPQCNPMNSSKSPQKMDSAFSTPSTPQTGRGNAVDNPEYYNACFVEQLNVGFFWAWNHMLPRKRRCYLTGDECFQDAMLADFRAFMNAEDDRLVHAFEVFIGNLNSSSDDDPNESFKKQD